MTLDREDVSLDLGTLRAAYREGSLTPTSVVETVLRRVADRGDDGVWISRVPDDQVLERAEELEGLDAGVRRRSG